LCHGSAVLPLFRILNAALNTMIFE
jgi:hypothetical protein